MAISVSIDTDRAVDRATALSWINPRACGTVVAVWLGVAVISTPALILIGPAEGWQPDILALGFLQTLLHFAPWAASSPIFLWLSRRLPLGMGRSWRHLSAFAVLSVVMIPVIAATGVLLNATVFPWFSDNDATLNFWSLNALRTILINGLFAFPIYVAMIAIGQTLTYLQRYREREAMLAQARHDALRAQFAPHFIFNALNVISELAYVDPESLETAILRLSRLLRATIDQPSDTTLDEEIAFLSDYIALNRLALGDRLEASIELDPAIKDASCPALLLQPLVENAIKHGVGRLPEGGRIRLRADGSGQNVVLRIDNDAPEENDAANVEGEGLGLAFVRRRLRTRYGERADLVFRRERDRASVTVCIPLRREERAG